MGMEGTLRVDPTHLRTAVESQAEVSTFVSSMTNGQSMATGGAGMSGLLSGAACRVAGSILDTAASAVHDDLTDHSAKLSAAADRYHRTDEELGRRLRKFAP